MNQRVFFFFTDAIRISVCYVAAAFLFLSLMACDGQESQDDGPKLYYDLKGVIANQIVYLNDKKPEINKTARLGDKTEVSKTRDLDWKKELELFIQADINKPSYRQSYNILRNGPVHYEYRLKANADLPVKYLKIDTDSVLNQPLYIEAVIHAENKIYDSEKKIVMRSVKRDNLLQVNFYEVDGYQKLIFVDRKVFSVKAEIGL